MKEAYAARCVKGEIEFLLLNIAARDRKIQQLSKANKRAKERIKELVKSGKPNANAMG